MGKQKIKTDKNGVDFNTFNFSVICNTCDSDQNITIQINMNNDKDFLIGFECGSCGAFESLIRDDEFIDEIRASK